MTNRSIAGSPRESYWADRICILQGDRALCGAPRAAFHIREHCDDGTQSWLEFTADDARLLADYLDLRTQKWKEAHS